MNTTMRRNCTVCLIPARAGSKRIPNKNVMDLNGHPMLAYTISAAIESNMFDSIIVSTDSEEYATIARHYGAEVPFLRPVALAIDSSPDIEWVSYTLSELHNRGRVFDHFALLRPTSPFRTANTIRRALKQFCDSAYADSLRAVERCTQHPAKMWRIIDDLLVPVLPVQPIGTEWFSLPTQSLPEVWVQNASLEIAHVRCVTEMHSISGTKIIAFKTEHPEGFDVNSSDDVVLLKSLLANSVSLLPPISAVSFPVANSTLSKLNNWIG